MRPVWSALSRQPSIFLLSARRTNLPLLTALALPPLRTASVAARTTLPPSCDSCKPLDNTSALGHTVPQNTLNAQDALLKSLRRALTVWENEKTTSAYNAAWDIFEMAWKCEGQENRSGPLRQRFVQSDFDRLLMALNLDESLCLGERWGRVRRVLKRRRKAGFDMDEHALNQRALASAYLMSFSDVLYFLGTARQRNIEPSLLTYTALLTGLLRGGVSDVPIRLLSVMTKAGVPPDEYIYNMLVEGFAKTGDFGRANHIVEKMRARNVQPGLVTYTSLINCYLQAGKFSEVDLCLREMEKARLPIDAYFVAVMQKLHVLVGDLDKAEQLMRDMRRKLLKPTKHMYTLLMGAYVSREDILNVERWFREMLSDNVVPDDLTLGTLIKAFVNVGDVTKAEKVFYDMVELHRVHPGIHSYSSLLVGYVREKDLRRVTALMSEMRENCIPMAQVPFSQIIVLYFKKKHDAAALKMFLMLLGVLPGSQARICWIEIATYLVEARKFDTIKTWYDKLKAFGIRCGGHSRSNGVESSWQGDLLRECYMQGHIRLGLRLWKRCRRANIPVDEATICAYLDLCRVRGKLSTARSELADLQDQGYTMTSAVYTAWIKTLAGRGQITQARRLLLEEMPAAGIKPTADAFFQFIVRARKHGAWKEAREAQDHLMRQYADLDREVHAKLVRGMGESLERDR